MIPKKDALILSHLRQDGRQTLTKMSKKTNIPISTIYDKLKLHDGELIKKHTCVLDFRKLGFSTRAFILLRVNKSCRDEMKDFLKKHMHVNSLSRVNNNFDFLAEVVYRDLRGIEELLETLEEKFKMKSPRVYYEIENIKTEEFLSDPSLVDVLL